mgnify:CR=1 FL=1
MTVKLAVFDCDGTLVDGQAAVCEAMEGAFADAGLAIPPRTAIRRIVGLSLPQAVRHLAPEAASHQHDQVVEAYKHAFRTARHTGQLEERVRVLERIVTASGYDLATQIEALRYQDSERRLGAPTAVIESPHTSSWLNSSRLASPAGIEAMQSAPIVDSGADSIS